MGEIMNNDPVVSIIIPFFNAEKYFQETVESVLVQTIDNWELLLVDDGSTDNSSAIALHYVNQYPRKIRYLEHENHQNRGRSESRNLGIRKAFGQYVALLDADDVWLPHNLEHQISLLEKRPEATMLYMTTLRWYSWMGDLTNLQRDNLYDLRISTDQLVEPPHLLNLMIQQKITIPCPSSVLLRRNDLKNIGLFEPAFPGMHDDQVFYAKVFLNTSVFVADGWGAKYRKHPDSCVATARKDGKEEQSHLRFLNWLKEYFIENKVRDSDLWNSLNQQLWRYRYLTLKHSLKLIFP